MSSVYNAFVNAGFSENQAKAMTSEVGRENDFRPDVIFGTHADAANNATNLGFFSWQKDRATALQSFLEEKGLYKDGQMVKSQESLDAMAQFAKSEMESGQYKGLGNFLDNKDVDSETAAKQLGTGYIKWRYGKDTLPNGDPFDWKGHDAKRKGYYDQISDIASKDTPGIIDPTMADTSKIPDQLSNSQILLADNLNVSGGMNGQAFDGGETHEGTLALAKAIQGTSESKGISLNRFTAFNDEYHQGTSSKHAKGLALDFTLNDAKQSAAAADMVRDLAKKAGVEAYVQDEYLNPSSRSTGGHIHSNFKSKEDADKFNEYVKNLQSTTGEKALANANTLQDTIIASETAKDVKKSQMVSAPITGAIASSTPSAGQDLSSGTKKIVGGQDTVGTSQNISIDTAKNEDSSIQRISDRYLAYGIG
jgi:hypothetical protein